MGRAQDLAAQRLDRVVGWEPRGYSDDAAHQGSSATRAAVRAPIVGSPYAVAPGRVRTRPDGPFQVFTPFFPAWQEHGRRAPAASDPATVAYPDATDAQRRERFATWCAGRTGYTFVDAGMRQLLATGWMHNRVRMVVASFLVNVLGEAAAGAGRTDTFLGARYRRLARRRGKKVAARRKPPSRSDAHC